MRPLPKEAVWHGAGPTTDTGIELTSDRCFGKYVELTYTLTAPTWAVGTA
jgi:hypothetical protein